MRIRVVHDDGIEAVYDVEEIYIPHHEGPLLVEAPHVGGIKITQSTKEES